MFYVFSIIFLSVFFVQLPSIVKNTPIRTDCYESFTYPPIYLNVTHYNPSGPLYFTSLFYYERYSILTNYGIQTERAEYNFKKIDKLCNSSILFTTMGEDLKKLHIEITINLFKNNGLMANINYNFYRGFDPGYYNLIDMDQNFALNLKIPEVAGQYLTTRMRLFYEDKSYLDSISDGNGELCIFTLNNNTAVLKPKYNFGLPSGFIFGMEVEVRRYGRSILNLTYAAFECKTHKKYPKEPVILIKNGKDYVTIYKVIYVKYIGFYQDFQYLKFEITHPKYEYVDRFRNIHPKYKRVYLSELKFKIIVCSDGSTPNIIYIKEDIQYVARVTKSVNISTRVEYFGHFERNPQDPCTE